MQYVFQITGKLRLQQVSALKAKKLYIKGMDIFVMPSGFRTPDQYFHGDAVRCSILDYAKSKKEQFENFVSRYKHANCCSLLGRGLIYYVKAN